MAEPSKSGFRELAKQASLQPQESLLEVRKSNRSLFIGVPRETTYQENRVALTPSSVQLLVNNEHEVYIETGAGKAARFSDKDYSEAGAKIVYSVEEVYKADVVVKVDPPTMDEINFMHADQILISAVQSTDLCENYLRGLMNKKVTAVGFELLKDNDGTCPIIRSMGEIAGSTAVIIAGEYLSSKNGGKGEMLGGVSGIPPTEVVIIGAGTVGEFAARAALGLGANIKIFDNSLFKLRRLQNNLSMRLFTSLIQPKVIAKAIANADVAIGALRSENGRSPSVVTEEMVSHMKPGSVIVDVSIDQGGCFETSEVTNHTKPVFRKYDVIHYCVPNIPSRVARTASYALSNILTSVLIRMSESGGFQNYIWENAGARAGVYIYKGNLTNKHIGNRFNIYHKDIDLLIAAHI